MLVMTKTFLRAQLDALASGSTAAGLLDGAFVGFITAIAPPATPDSVLADVTESANAAYARVAFTGGIRRDSADGLKTEYLGPLASLTGDVATPENIIGAILCSAVSAGDLWAVDIFDEPFPLPDSNAELVIIPLYSETYGWDFGRSTVVS